MDVMKETGPDQFLWRHRRITVHPPTQRQEVNVPLRRRIVTCHFKQAEKDKYLKLIKLLLLAAIPTLIVVIQSVLNLNEKLEMFNACYVVKYGVQTSIKVSDMVHKVQIERGTTALYVSSNGDPIVKQRLAAFYKQTDITISSNSELTNVYTYFKFQSSSELLDYISAFRGVLDPGNTTIRKVIDFYTGINTVLIRKIADVVRMEKPFNFWTDLAAYELLILSKEEAGIERALGSTYFARGMLAIPDLLWYNEKRILGIRFLDECLQFSNYAKRLVLSLTEETPILESITHLRSEIINNSRTSPSVQSGTMWFDNMTTYINVLKSVQDDIASRIVKSAEDNIASLREMLIASAVQLAITIIMLPVVFVLVRNIVSISSKLRERTTYLEEEKRQTEILLHELEEERKRTEELLYQLLPKAVAQTLMENGQVNPESFDSVTIMFSDVVGFTTIASISTPMQVVKMLNKLYMTIDEHLEHFDTYKVETIGDAYMVASGLPRRNGESHVIEVAKLAIDLLAEQIQIPHIENETISLRIGINTGPCVAGVVGIRMPRYCIFGDTVNTASRMESTGLPRRIQMTKSSATKLQQNGSFAVSERGKVNVKVTHATCNIVPLDAMEGSSIRLDRM